MSDNHKNVLSILAICLTLSFGIYRKFSNLTLEEQIYYSKLCVAEENIKKLQAHPERVNFITADTSSSKANKTGNGPEGHLPYQFVLNNESLFEKLSCC